MKAPSKGRVQDERPTSPFSTSSVGSIPAVPANRHTMEANRQKENAMRNYYYFSHDANAHDDNKLRVILCDYGYAGYGLYWLAIEIMRQEPNVSMPMNDLTYKTLRSHAPKDNIDIPAFIQDCVAVGLFEIDEDGCFYSRSLRNRVDQALDVSKKRSEAGKASRSGNKRSASVQQNQTNAEQMLSTSEHETSNHPANAVKDKDKDSSSGSSGTRACAEDQPESFSAVQYVSTNIVGMTAGNWEDLQSMMQDGLSDELIIHGVDEAGAQGVHTWAYLRKILNRYLTSGVTTVEQAKIEEAQRAVAAKPSARASPNKNGSGGTGNIFADLLKGGGLGDG